MDIVLIYNSINLINKNVIDNVVEIKIISISWNVKILIKKEIFMKIHQLIDWLLVLFLFIFSINYEFVRTNDRSYYFCCSLFKMLF